MQEESQLHSTKPFKTQLKADIGQAKQENGTPRGKKNNRNNPNQKKKPQIFGIFILNEFFFTKYPFRLGI